MDDDAGFRKDAALTACCGDGGPHNSGVLISCNATSVLCPDPSEHISWDGLHLTEAASGSWRGACWTGPTPRRLYCPRADVDPHTKQLQSRV